MPCCERGVLCCLLGVVTAGPTAVPPPHGALSGVTSACGYPKNGWQLRAGQGRVPGRCCCFLLPPRTARSCWAALSLLGFVSCRRRRIARGALLGAPTPSWGRAAGRGGHPAQPLTKTFSSFFFLWCWDPARKREGERMAQLRTASWARVPWMTSSTCPPNSASRPVPGRPGCPLPPPPARAQCPPCHPRVRAAATAPPRRERPELGSAGSCPTQGLGSPGSREHQGLGASIVGLKEWGTAMGGLCGL